MDEAISALKKGLVVSHICDDEMAAAKIKDIMISELKRRGEDLSLIDNLVLFVMPAGAFEL